MVHLTRGLVASTAAAALLLSACNGSGPEPSPPPTATDSETATGTETVPDNGPTATETTSPTESAPDVELETLYDAPTDATRDFPEPVESLTASTGDQLDIFGVHRLADDRVVVTGALTFEDRPNSDFVASALVEEPGFRYDDTGPEFALFELTVSGDDTIYLPVRDEENRCQCSVVRPGFQEEGLRLPVMAVMSSPADAATVNLSAKDFGEFTDLPVTELPELSRTPWGLAQSLAVTEARRADGLITARVSVATVEEGAGYGMGVYQSTRNQNCFFGLTAVGAPRGTWDEENCYSARLPSEGQAVDFEVTFPDPGTDDVVLLPWNGYPLTVPIEGQPAEGGDDVIRTYASRTFSEGTTVSSGEEIEVLLDTSVLFDFDEATLTSGAAATLEVAAEALQAQDGRSLTIDGHTDLQGEAGYNLDLSLARAEAVRDALEDLLGDGWTFEVNGYGQQQPLAQERGTPAEIEAAQARNRRVEITVDN